jgi:hypothetical protein
VSGLRIGTVFKLENPSFKDGGDVAYDARVEVIDLSRPDGGNASSISVQGVNEWMHLSASFAEAGTLSTANTTGTARTLADIASISVSDIDSNPGDRDRHDFTDVAGIDYAIGRVGDALEEGGFLQPGAPMTGATGDAINYVRLDPDFVPGQRWKTEPNYKPTLCLAEEDFVARFDVGGALTRFDFVRGSTGVSSGNTRGFDLRIDPGSAISAAPVPLPNALPLLLVGLGAFGAMRAGPSRRLTARPVDGRRRAACW